MAKKVFYFLISIFFKKNLFFKIHLSFHIISFQENHDTSHSFREEMRRVRREKVSEDKASEMLEMQLCSVLQQGMSEDELGHPQGCVQGDRRETKGDGRCGSIERFIG